MNDNHYDRVDHEAEYDADDALLQGAGKSRKFTDVFCFIMFSLAILAFIGVMGITGVKGDISNVAIPVDRDGNLCGRNNGPGLDFTGWKYLYLSPNDLKTDATLSFKNRVCVQSCPVKNQELSCPSPNPYGDYCTSDKNVPLEDTEEFLGRFCMPSSKNLFSIVTDQFFGFFGGQEYAKDIVELWWAIAIGVCQAIGISILQIFLMKYMAVVFIIAVIIVTLGGLGWAGWWCCDTALGKWNFADKLGPGSPEKDSYKSDGWTWMWVAIAVWSLDAILLLITLCTICQIQNAIKILSLASDFVGDVCQVILAPIWTTLIFLVWMAVCSFAFLFIYSMGTVKRSPTSVFTTMAWDDGEWIYLTVQILIAMWVCSWIISYTYFIISALTVEWYFKAQTGTPVSMTMSMKWGVVYHAGTLAFGAFLIVIVWVLRIAVNWAMKAAKKATGDNCCVKCIACFLNCYCKCLENFIQFINRHAYVEVVLRSCNFCTGAKQGWNVISKNAAKFGFMNTILTLFNFLLVLLVAGGSTAIVHLIVTASEGDKFAQMDSRSTPIAVVVFLLSYLIGKLFMSIYAISADTIMHCFCIEFVVGKKSGKGIHQARDSIKGFALENDRDVGNSVYGDFNF